MAFVHGLAERGDLQRVGDAGGIAERDAGDAEIFDAIDDLQHARGGHRAFERAAERRGDGRIQARRRAFGRSDHVGEARQRLVGGHAQIGAAVAVGGRHHEIEFVGAGVERTLDTFRVRNQGHVIDVGSAP